jgi:hypothetical protein
MEVGVTVGIGVIVGDGSGVIVGDGTGVRVTVALPTMAKVGGGVSIDGNGAGEGALHCSTTAQLVISPRNGKTAMAIAQFRTSVTEV